MDLTLVQDCFRGGETLTFKARRGRCRQRKWSRAKACDGFKGFDVALTLKSAQRCLAPSVGLSRPFGEQQGVLWGWGLVGAARDGAGERKAGVSGPGLEPVRTCSLEEAGQGPGLASWEDHLETVWRGKG